MSLGRLVDGRLPGLFRWAARSAPAIDACWAPTEGRLRSAPALVLGSSLGMSLEIYVFKFVLS